MEVSRLDLRAHSGFQFALPQVPPPLGHVRQSSARLVPLPAAVPRGRCLPIAASS